MCMFFMIWKDVIQFLYECYLYVKGINLHSNALYLGDRHPKSKSPLQRAPHVLHCPFLSLCKTLACLHISRNLFLLYSLTSFHTCHFLRSTLKEVNISLRCAKRPKCKILFLKNISAWYECDWLFALVTLNICPEITSSVPQCTEALGCVYIKPTRVRNPPSQCWALILWWQVKMKWTRTVFWESFPDLVGFLKWYSLPV